ncbi:hypothetical protein ACFO1B_07215 [Dactylosporangium siamense]|uniref:Uncharacterized protein n=1 Tax=Dactylosporangium siamense TaxID=685454 RepID=A0A919PH52_9ACTN|nr:hypothetical protein [Dactylosporangium siamense]GIG43549.1 hypothetical protein Dsi01nite_015900 [Dactylosporangium siamense]
MTVESDEQDGATLLRPLAGGHPHGRSTVDIARAIADGDRHHRRVRLVGSAGAGATVVLVVVAGWTVAANSPQKPAPAATKGSTSPSTGPTVAAVGCTVQQLATPEGEGVRAVIGGGDPTGKYLVGRTYPGGRPSTVVWENLRPRKVPMQGEDPSLTGATSTGVFIGSSYTGADTLTAWVYKDGRFLKLAGSGAIASAINEREVIVGSVQGRPAMWASPTAQPTMLPMPAGKGWTGGASGVDDDGTIVGTLENSEVKGGQAYVWRPDGTVTKLAQPMVRGKPAMDYRARTVRGGWAVGWASYDEPDRGPRWLAAPRWNLRTGAVDSTDGVFTTINAQGRIAGQLAVIAPDRTTVALPLPSGFDAKSAMVMTEAISDDGTVVAGYLNDRNGSLDAQPIAVVWKCGS